VGVDRSLSYTKNPEIKESYDRLATLFDRIRLSYSEEQPQDNPPSAPREYSPARR